MLQARLFASPENVDHPEEIHIFWSLRKARFDWESVDKKSHVSNFNRKRIAIGMQSHQNIVAIARTSFGQRCMYVNKRKERNQM
jgi:hypothetical protein